MGHQAEGSDRSCHGLAARVSEPRIQSWLPISVRRIWVTIVLFGLAVFLLGLTLDLFLIHQKGLRPLTAAAILNAFFAVVAALLVHRLLAFERDKCNRILDRLEVVDQMNHHIRNALQVISFSAHTASTESELSEIKNAVTRIQWAVREILPKVEPEFAVYETTSRNTDSDGAHK